MAELEIDDVAFLSGDSRSHVTCESCHGLCGRRSRFSSSGPGSRVRGLSSLLSILCPNGLSRSIIASATFASLIFIILLLALIFAFVTPSSTKCTGHDFDDENDSENTHQLPFRATNGELFPWQQIRLPSFIQPVHYDIFLHPNISTFKLKGSVEIVISILNETNFLVMHSKDLNIEDIRMASSSPSRVIPIRRFLTCIENQELYIEFDESLAPSEENYILVIEFSRTMEERLEGFYISSYIDSSSEKKRYIATTHFEPTAARSAFPCFDEPAMKAVFALKMVHEANQDVFFNTERQSIDPYNSEGLKISVFEETVRMSTYLIAFSICDFKTQSARTREGVHVRVIVPADMINQANFALSTATDILSYFQGFFNLTYPLSKLDLMAVPDFSGGAMENWGLITFRTTTILYNEAESSSNIQEQVAVVISHELAHQWFGNLVTMEWWNDLWLNEGFASFVEVLGVDAFHPEWRLLDQFIVGTTQEALAMDALESSHAIMANVRNPSDIEAIFDIISYKKGSALIRMLENFLKTDVLRIGLNKYLNKYQYRNAKTSDLWQSFSESVPNSSVNVTAIMDRWTKQKGYPVISASIDYNKNLLHLSQRRFLSSPSDMDHDSVNHEAEASPFGYQWIVPITMVTNKVPDTSRLIWLSQRSASVSTFDPTVEWFKLNVNQSGFYRVNYDDTNWRRLIEQLHSRHYTQHILSPADRSNLLDDAITFMKVSQLSSDLALNLTAYLETGERDYVPWETALNHFANLDAIMNGHPLMRKYFLKLIQPTLNNLGWNDDGSHLTRKLRASLLKAAVLYGHDPTIEITRKRFDEWIVNRHRVPANFREVVYSSGVRFGGSKEWEFCWKKYKNSKIPSEQRLLLDALTSTRNVWLLNRLLNYSIDKERIKPQDTAQVLVNMARNSEARLLVWRFVRENWTKILSLFGEGSFTMDNIISGVTFHFSREFDLNEVTSFFAKVRTGSGKEAVKQSIERIRANIYWKKYVEDQVVNWLQRRNFRY